MKKSNLHHDYIVERLKDPEYAQLLLNATLEDEDPRVFLLCLRDVCEAYGIGRLAKGTHISREHFYRMLSNNGNPQWDTLRKVMDKIGFRITVQLKTDLAA